MADWTTYLSLFVAFVGWATGYGIMRRGSLETRGFFTYAFGALSVVLIYIVPPLIFGLWSGLIFVIVSLVLSGVISGFLIGLAVASPRWPTDFLVFIAFGPVVFYFLSALISVLTYVNAG